MTPKRSYQDLHCCTALSRSLLWQGHVSHPSVSGKSESSSLHRLQPQVTSPLRRSTTVAGPTIAELVHDGGATRSRGADSCRNRDQRGRPDRCDCRPGPGSNAGASAAAQWHLVRESDARSDRTTSVHNSSRACGCGSIHSHRRKPESRHAHSY